MKILVTGASGFVGRHLVSRLINEGHQVKGLVRRGSKKAAPLRELGAEVVNGDVTDADAIEKAARGCDAVFSLVGLLYEPKGYTFEAVHYGGVKNIISACRKAGIKRVIHISALGVGPHSKSEYHRTKGMAEEALIQSGLDYTIFRPSVIFGKDDAFVNLFAPMLRRLPLIGIIGSGDYRMQPVHIDDLTTCMAASISDKNTIKEIFEIGGGEALTFNDIMDTIASAVGRRVFKFPIPLFIAWPMAWFMGMMPKPIITTDQLKMLLSDNICDNKKLEEIFGIKPAGFREELKMILS